MLSNKQPVNKLDYAREKLKSLIIECVKNPDNFQAIPVIKDEQDRAFLEGIHSLAAEIREEVDGKRNKAGLTVKRLISINELTRYVIANRL